MFLCMYCSYVKHCCSYIKHISNNSVPVQYACSFFERISYVIPHCTGMPKAPPVDPAVREKFADEFLQVEAELEKMYSNPTSVWQDILRQERLNDDNDEISNSGGSGNSSNTR